MPVQRGVPELSNIGATVQESVSSNLNRRRRELGCCSESPCSLSLRHVSHGRSWCGLPHCSRASRSSSAGSDLPALPLGTVHPLAAARTYKLPTTICVTSCQQVWLLWERRRSPPALRCPASRQPHNSCWRSRRDQCQGSTCPIFGCLIRSMLRPGVPGIHQPSLRTSLMPWFSRRARKLARLLPVLCSSPQRLFALITANKSGI